MQRLAVVGAPASCGAHAPGQERAPQAFREAGLVALLEGHGLIVDDRGDLPLVRWTPDRIHPRAQHAEEVAAIARVLACVEAFTHHPKFAALTICEFNPDHVDEQRLLVSQFVEGLVAALLGP